VCNARSENNDKALRKLQGTCMYMSSAVVWLVSAFSLTADDDRSVLRRLNNPMGYSRSEAREWLQKRFGL
jgi:hypothetical protein